MRRPVDDSRPAAAANAAVRLRAMTAHDVARIVDIEKDGFRHPWSADLLRRELHHDWSTSLVAARDGAKGEEILGFIVYWVVHDEVHVLNIAVALEARRQGIARLLMDEASRRGRAAGAKLATLEVRRSNEPAIRLYETLGYRRVGVRPNYYVDEGEDAIVMVLDL
jgi:ribosomal-protein-alanine N-acetyltransferase